ncbi:MAG: sigma 54-interacting transcriptional regulator [Phaeodactylibacter xiamenensis]|jgi:PAS domain S-box-containing protein|uniref:sigma 54-interacting transcriptional regulator n=1 Tax=Phaeodactylibacter xiamenensis TaxID=1524460 RepID=UPI0013627195|nr:sigma 54-interacting transcriptional regulator [Phaeodactylibacter xiamenensis]MCR9053606.1 sigma 54-interacting transcriptional regulator [bacterium]
MMSRSLSITGGSEIRASNNLINYQKVLESFGFGTLIVRKDGSIHLASNRVAQELGYEPQLLSNKRIFEINPHLSLIQWRKKWKELVQTRHLEMETEFMNASEMLFPVQLRLSLIEHDGEPFCLVSVKNLLHANRYKKLLRLTTEVSQVGGWEWDLVTDRIMLTEGVYALLRIPNKHMDKEQWTALLEDRLPPEDHKAFDFNIRTAIETGEPCRFDLQVQQPEGHYSKMSVTIVPEKSEFQTIKLYGALQDITELKSGQEGLELTQYTLDHAREMIFWETADGSFLYGNLATREKLGYTNTELKAMKVDKLVHNFSVENRAESWAALREHRVLDWEGELKAKDGTVIPVYCSMNLIRYKDKEINCVFAKDWRRKKARDERLRLSLFTLDEAVDMIFWVDDTGALKFVNQTAYKSLGYEAFELWDELFPRSAELAFQDLWKASGAHQVIYKETEVRKANGQWLPVDVYINFISFEGKDYACAFLRDISARKAKNRELAAALDKVQELSDRLQTENTLLKEEIKVNYNFENIISESKAYKTVLHQVEQVAATEATVLIIGETGTGKELLARSIHALSKRKDEPMIKVNCAALPANLIESELFGHEKGAFTNAYQRKKGRFELADGGTIFLDEVGELPLGLQSKFLRVLQEGEFERVGGTTTLSTDVRVVAATNRNLVDLVNEGAFREDLYYRLNVFPIQNLPLRERREDIPLLVRHFVKKFAGKQGKEIEHISQSDLDELMRYEFPGNIRELENMIERAVIISKGKSLLLADAYHKSSSQAVDKKNHSRVFKSFEEMQRDYIIEALRRCNWRISGPKGAATLLDLNSRTLASKMRKFGINRKDFIDK